MKNRSYFSLAILASAFLSAHETQAQVNTVTVMLGKSECADSCSIDIPNHKGPASDFFCGPEDLVRGSKTPVCLELFGTGGQPPNLEGRTATLTISKYAPRGPNSFWIKGGRLHPVAGQPTTTTQGQSSQGKAQQGGGWDSWLEATGNKAKVAPPVSPSEIKISGNSPTGVETVVKVCQHLVNVTGPGKPGIGAIFAIEYLSPVDAASVYGNIGPQGKLIPLKLYARYRDGEKMYSNGYLRKDAFGEYQCIAAR